MSTVSFLTPTYDKVSSNFFEKPQNNLTRVFFNYAQLTWSSPYTHGSSMIESTLNGRVALPSEKGSLRDLCLFVANWVLLSTLLVVKTSCAVSILSVSLAVKLYHCHSLISLSKAFPVSKPLENFVEEAGKNQFYFSIHLDKLSQLMKASEHGSVPEVTQEEIEGLFSEFPEAANLPNKDGHLVSKLIKGSFVGGLPILRKNSFLNQEFISDLKIVLSGISKEKSPVRKKKLFTDLCTAFQGCQPEQQRGVATIAGEFRAASGTIENFLFEKLKLFLDHLLEQTIIEFHGDQISTAVMAKPHLQMPHIKSRYLQEFTKAGLFLPNYAAAQHDHVVNGTYGGIPPYKEEALMKFKEILHDQAISFFDLTALELSSGNEVMTAWLYEFTKKDEDLTSFGFYSEQLEKRGWYKHLNKPIEAQEDLLAP